MQSLQEGGALGGGQRVERLLERLVTLGQPCAHGAGRRRAEVDDRPAAVVLVLAPFEEVVIREVANQRARRRQREAHLVRDLADRHRPGGRDMGQDGDVARAEMDVELEVGAPVPPKAPEHGPEHSPELRQLFLACHVIIVPVR